MELNHDQAAAFEEPNPFEADSAALQLEAVEPDCAAWQTPAEADQPRHGSTVASASIAYQQRDARPPPHPYAAAAAASHQRYAFIPSAAPMTISSHGAQPVQGLELCEDDVAELNPFESSSAGNDSPHLPAHSRAHPHSHSHPHPHLIAVAPLDPSAFDDASGTGVVTTEEVVPHWQDELRTLLSLALPSVLLNFTSVGMSVGSQMLIGHVSVEALAGAVCSTMWFNLSWMFTIGFAGALDTLAAQSYGAGSMEGVNLWTKRALLLVSLVSIPTMIALLFGSPVLQHVLGQSEEVSREGGIYCRWLIFGLYPQNLTIVLQKYLQAQEVLWPIIWQGVFANIANLVLESLFIWGFGWGLGGAALGMGLARWMQFIAITLFCMRHHAELERKKLEKVAAEVAHPHAMQSNQQQQQEQDGMDVSAADGIRSEPRTPARAALALLRSSSLRVVTGVRDEVLSSASTMARGFRSGLAYARTPRSLVADLDEQRLAFMEGTWNVAAIKQFCILGVSGGAMTGVESWAFDGMGILAAALTVVELDAHYILLNVALTCYFSLPLGISIAASIRVGHLVGMGHVRTAQLTTKLVAVCGAGFMALTGMTISLSRRSVGYIFSSDANVVAQVSRIAPICGLMQTADGVQGSTSGVLRGLGLQKWAAVINVVGLWVLAVPVGYVLCFPGRMGLPGLWWGFVVGLWSVAAGNLLLMWRVDWHKQVAEARRRIALDMEEYAARRAAILAEVARGKDDLGVEESQIGGGDAEAAEATVDGIDPL